MLKSSLLVWRTLLSYGEPENEQNFKRRAAHGRHSCAGRRYHVDYVHSGTKKPCLHYHAKLSLQRWNGHILANDFLRLCTLEKRPPFFSWSSMHE